LNVLRCRRYSGDTARLFYQLFGFRFGQLRHRVASAELGDNGSAGSLVVGSSSKTGAGDGPPPGAGAADLAPQLADLNVRLIAQRNGHQTTERSSVRDDSDGCMARQEQEMAAKGRYQATAERLLIPLSSSRSL
jgi:hypothetical protein